MPSTSLLGVDPAADFVINSGRYFHGTTGRPYQPAVKVPDPLPAAAYLYWGLRAQGASSEHDRLLCALQRHTGVGVNAFSIKNSGGQLGFEIYVTMYPPMLRAMHGREVPLIDCLQLSDKVRIHQAIDENPRPLFRGASKAESQRLVRDLEDLRNSLAHAQDIVTHDWTQVVRLARRLDELAGT